MSLIEISFIFKFSILFEDKVAEFYAKKISKFIIWINKRFISQWLS